MVSVGRDAEDQAPVFQRVTYPVRGPKVREPPGLQAL